ncbi:FBP domain-containing protein [Planomonospora algeriensis]
MPARRTGEAGRQGDSVGQYLCTGLACSLYTRGRKQAAGAGSSSRSPSPRRRRPSAPGPTCTPSWTR